MKAVRACPRKRPTDCPPARCATSMTSDADPGCSRRQSSIPRDNGNGGLRLRASPKGERKLHADVDLRSGHHTQCLVRPRYPNDVRRALRRHRQNLSLDRSTRSSGAGTPASIIRSHSWRVDCRSYPRPFSSQLTARWYQPLRPDDSQRPACDGLRSQDSPVFRELPEPAPRVFSAQSGRKGHLPSARLSVFRRLESAALDAAAHTGLAQ
jgi:hypothetical protein